MNIAIFGLGYVGTVTAGCLTKDGHTVVGVDVQPDKVAALQAGVAPLIEPGLNELLTAAVRNNRLTATVDAADALTRSHVSLVCVGTPSRLNGALDLAFVRAVVREIGECLRGTGRRHTLVLRSTMLPGSTRALVDDLLSDLVAEHLLEVYYFPEFLREGSGVADFRHPSLSVVGTRDGGSPPCDLMTVLFGREAAVVDWSTAEMVKYAANAFHATKIAFANEIGRLGKHLGLDSRAVMQLLCQDTKLNLSAHYLRPGNPFGGSCLPKDVRALTHHARSEGVSVPLLESLLPSNERHLQALLSLVTESGQTEVCLLGLTFKAGTDDLREAPMVEVAQALLGRGYTVRIYDPALQLSALRGANRRLIDVRMPHLATLLRPDVASAIGGQGLVIVTQQCATPEELKPVLTDRHRVLDVNSWPALRALAPTYDGLCW